MPSDNLTTKIEIAFQAFILDCKARKLRPRSIQFYENQLGYFFDFLQKENLSDITTTDIRRYFVYLQDKGLADSSVHAAARSIRAFLNFCEHDEWLQSNPFRRIRMPRRDLKLLKSFTMAEIRTLLDAAATQRDRALMLCLLDTGCRISEVASWNVEDIDIRSGTVTVMGKNRKERTVYLGNRSRKELLRLFAAENLEPGDPVWTSHTSKKRLSKNGLQQIFRRLKVKTGIEHCSAHTFRRTFAIESLRNGMNIYALQRLMDHSDLTVLRRYLDLVERDLKEAAQRHGVVDNLT